MADITDITSTEIERRNFIKKAAVAAWSAPVILTMVADRANAKKPGGGHGGGGGGGGASCVKPGSMCVPDGVPCCNNQSCRPVDHGRFQCVGPKR
jgi:hypothetical protein